MDGNYITREFINVKGTTQKKNVGEVCLKAGRLDIMITAKRHTSKDFMRSFTI